MPSSDPASRLRRTVGAIAVLAASVALLVVVASFGGRFDARLDVLAHLRLALLEGCLAVLGLAWCAGSRRAALLIGLALALDGAPIAMLYFGRESPSASGDVLRLLLFNVRQNNPRLEDVVAFVRDQRADLIVLQEVTPQLDRAMVESRAFELVSRELRPDPLSAALYRSVDSSVEVSASEVLRADSSPVAIGFLRATCRWRGHGFTLIAPRVLPPTKGAAARDLRRNHFVLLGELVRNAGACIVLGDLNTTPFSSDFHALIADSALIDSEVGFGYQPTWPSYGLARLAPIPIDHALHSREFVTRERHVHRDALGSDHFPVVVELSWRD